MNRYKIRYVQNGEEEKLYVVAPNEDVAMMFFELAFDDVVFLSIDKAVVQIITPKLCSN
jgi:hypothetical protein